MPVRIKRAKDILTIEVGEETFKCKWLNERAVSTLYSGLGEYDEAKAEFKLEPGKYTEFCYDLASKILKGWENVMDEDGDPVAFKSALIPDLSVETVTELAGEYMAQRMGAQVEMDEELKNSKSTSRSRGTSRSSKDAADVPKTTESIS